MSRFLLPALLGGLLGIVCPLKAPRAERADDAQMFQVMSFNIRYHNPQDGPHAWPHRRDWVAEIIREHDVDIACLQEALQDQVADLEERLPDYAWYGVGRDDGQQRGEFTPIFYRKARFERTDQGRFWLSETPQQPGSKGWDAFLPRIATWVKLHDKIRDKPLLVLSTHLDHRGAQARRQSAQLLLEQSARLAGPAAVVLAGDFNCLPTATPYRILTGGEDAPEPAPLPLRDARHASASGHQGPDSTWNGFQEIIPGMQIDFIFVSPQLRVVEHAILEVQRDGRFPSDHLPVWARLECRPEMP